MTRKQARKEAVRRLQELHFGAEDRAFDEDECAEWNALNERIEKIDDEHRRGRRARRRLRP